VLTAARPLVIAVAAVVTSFIVALWLSQHRLNDVERNVYEIAANAEPSVVRLEDARAQLERIGLHIDEYVAALEDHLPREAEAARVRAGEARDRFHDSLAAYERLPFFAGEESMYREFQAALEPAALAARTVVGEAAIRELDPATRELVDQLHPDIERLDSKLASIIQYDTAQAVEKLEAIAASRRRSWQAAMIGGTFSLLLSVFATALAAFALWKEAAARRRIDEEHGARLHAEQEVRRRDQFLILVAHELRTPLAALQLAVEAVARKAAGLPSALQANATRQVARMNALVEDLILVSQLDLGSVVMHPASVDLLALTRARIQGEESNIVRSGCTVCLLGETPVVGRWDASALQRVVDKLLANAIRFGQGRPIDVAVSQDEGRARLVVRDRGIGIPPDRIDAVFDRFERGVSERNYPGLGLGLFIVRSLVQAMGGTIVVASSPSEGTSFTVELPVDIGSAATKRGEPTGASSSDDTPRTQAGVLAGTAPRPASATR
jgi:signal transduction histidine kinase